MQFLTFAFKQAYWRYRIFTAYIFICNVALTCEWLQTFGFGLDLALLVAFPFPELLEILPGDAVDLMDGFCVFCNCVATAVEGVVVRCCCCCCVVVCCCCCCVCCMICWMSSSCCFVRPSLLAPGDVAFCKIHLADVWETIQSIYLVLKLLSKIVNTQKSYHRILSLIFHNLY